MENEPRFETLDDILEYLEQPEVLEKFKQIEAEIEKEKKANPFGIVF